MAFSTSVFAGALQIVVMLMSEWAMMPRMGFYVFGLAVLFVRGMCGGVCFIVEGILTHLARWNTNPNAFSGQSL